MLTAGGGGTSALSVNASAALNGVYIVCSDRYELTSDIQEAVAIFAGEWDDTVSFLKEAGSSSLQQVFSHWSHTYGWGIVLERVVMLSCLFPATTLIWLSSAPNHSVLWK